MEVAAAMIKRFHALYVGQIELENIGLDGTPANDRRYTNDELASVFDKTEAIAKSWTNWATTLCGWPSTISSMKATSACPTS